MELPEGIRVMRKVLIVDDDPLILFSLERTFKKSELEVTTARNGGEALASVEDSFYNLCFLDIHLPDITGMEVMRKIKEASPETKIIIMTCDTLCEKDEKEIENNAYEFIPKPFDLLQIKTVMKQALGENSGFIEKRTSERKVLVSPPDYIFDLVIGESKTLSLRATVLDTCRTGIGIRTGHTLHRGQKIMFKLGAERKTGIVRWSSVACNTAEDSSYRAGIELLQTAV